jgi:hypothetical protein
MKDLPEFKVRRRENVLELVEEILTNDIQQLRHSELIELIDYPDGHYRVLFNPRYFILIEGQTEPSKSQWNTLKKKFKRREPNIFVFKDHGETKTVDGKAYYVDFGFFLKPRRRED